MLVTELSEKYLEFWIESKVATLHEHSEIPNAK